jgi:hypothetical protein
MRMMAYRPTPKPAELLLAAGATAPGTGVLGLGSPG